MSLPSTLAPGAAPGLTHPLLPKLRALKLSGMLQTLETRAAQAAQSQLAPTEFLALLLDDELAETDQELLECGQIDRPAPANTLQGCVDARLLHHSTGESGIEGWQGQSAVAVHLDKLAAAAKEKDRPELWIVRAANDQFVPIQLDHWLDGDAEVCIFDF